MICYVCMFEDYVVYYVFMGGMVEYFVLFGGYIKVGELIVYILWMECYFFE